MSEPVYPSRVRVNRYLIYPEGVQEVIPVDGAELARMGVRPVAVPSVRDAAGRVLYDPQGVVDALSRLLAESEGERTVGRFG